MAVFFLRNRRTLAAAAAVSLAVATWAPACGSGPSAGDPASTPQDAAFETAPDARAVSDGGTDANPPPGTYAKLINDDQVWKEVPTVGGGGPVLHEARVTPDPFPPRVWTACGAGCRASPASLPFDVRLLYGAMTASGTYVAGDGYLLLHSKTKEVAAQLVRLERLSDGSTVAAVIARGQKTSGGLAYRGGSAALAIALVENSGNIRFARASADGAPLVWQPRWRDDVPIAATERIGIGDSVGVATYGGSLLFPTPTTETPIEIQPGTAVAHGQAGQLLFGYSGGTIYSFTVAGGVAPFITLAASRLAVAVRTSPDRIVWIDGVRSGEGWDALQWHWSPLVASPAAVVVNDGPAFPAGSHTSTWDLHTTGDWAIGEVGIGPDGVALPRQLVAWNIATGATYLLPNKPGTVFQRAFILTPTEMVLGYRNPTSADNALEELVRIELANLPDVISRWAAGTE